MWECAISRSDMCIHVVHVCVHMWRIYIYIYIYVCVCACACVYFFCTVLSMNLYLSVCLFICLFVYVVFVRIYTCALFAWVCRYLSQHSGVHRKMIKVVLL